jgi:hypothetical protein
MTGHADSAFRSQQLFRWIRNRRWKAILGLRGNPPVTLDPECAGTKLSRWLPDRETVV